MRGTGRTAISSESDCPPCRRIPQSPIMGSCDAANCGTFRPYTPIVPFLRPASIAITGIPTVHAATSSSTTSWAASSLPFRLEADGMAIAIYKARLIDGAGQAVEQATVIIQGHTIAAAGPSRSISIPRGATRIDGRGVTVLPGLIDCHVHLCWRGEADVVKAS